MSTYLADLFLIMALVGVSGLLVAALAVFTDTFIQRRKYRRANSR
jgi:hypothetical protein